MRSIKDIASEIVEREGGYVNDPDDPGGATKYGVTIGTMRRLGVDLDGDGDVDITDVKALSANQARDIFLRHYFHRPRIGDLPEQLHATVFDMNVNAGANAIKILQRLLNDMGQAGCRGWFHRPADGCRRGAGTGAGTEPPAGCLWDCAAQLLLSAGRPEQEAAKIRKTPRRRQGRLDRAGRRIHLAALSVVTGRAQEAGGTMGLIDTVVGGVFGSGNKALRETIEVFRENSEAGAERDVSRAEAVLEQFAAEFTRDQKGAFDRFMDGVNRLPRPAMAIGTLFLFGAAMVDPLWFAARMQGIALVPDPLWWLLGAVVSFYFGARHQAKGQDFQRSLAQTMVAAKSMTPRREVAATPSEENAALHEWQAHHDR